MKKTEFAILLDVAIDNLARMSFTLLVKSCEFFVKHFNCTTNDVVYCGEEDFKMAHICLRFLKALGFDENSVSFSLRSEGQAQVEQNWWCEKFHLSPTAKFNTIKAHDISRRESSNIWVGFQLIDVQHDETRRIDAASVMLLCSISVGINH